MEITGSGLSGFVGSYLRKKFEARGQRVHLLGHNDFGADAAALANKMEGADIIINLAGATISKRWTEAYKKLIYSSRIGTTRKIVEAMALMQKRPLLFISTSAVGRYPALGTHTEESQDYAKDHLGRVAADWEAEALKAEAAGIRTVIFRFGIVIGPKGGILANLLTPFRLGLGGTIGNGSQPFSWVHIEDIARAYNAVIGDAKYSGIYNLCSPEPSTNRGLTEALAKALHRPAIFRIPLFMLKLQFGEGANVFASGQTVLPQRLLDQGFSFVYANIDEAVKDSIS